MEKEKLQKFDFRSFSKKMLLRTAIFCGTTSVGAFGAEKLHDMLWTDDYNNAKVEELYKIKIAEAEERAEKHFSINEALEIELPNGFTLEQAKEQYMEKIEPPQEIMNNAKSLKRWDRLSTKFGLIFVGGWIAAVYGYELVTKSIARLNRRKEDDENTID